jgi:ribosome-associated toxin RatA of RatAB toxin-antitoxin module
MRFPFKPPFVCPSAGLSVAPVPRARGLAYGLVAAMLMAAVPALRAASLTEVDTHRNGDLIEVRARAIIEAPFSLVWNTLVDYERLPEFIPGLKKSRITARNGAVTTISQTGEARFLFLAIPIEVTVEATERPPRLEVRRITGTLRHLTGRYEAEVMTDPSRVLLRWSGAIAPESDLPPLIGEAVVRLLMREQFVGMVREIERRATLPGPITTLLPSVAQ